MPNTTDCYARTPKGLMPGVKVGKDEYGRQMVKTAGGRVYTYEHSKDVLSLEDGQRELAASKTKKVVEAYEWKKISLTPRVFLCSYPRSKTRIYAIVEGSGGWYCSCPAYAKNNDTCKHIDGLKEKLEEMARKRDEAALIA